MKIPSLQNIPGPLSPEVAAKLDAILTSLPIDHSAWLCGFFAGLNAVTSRSHSNGAQGASTEAAPVSATILYGSQTGNAEKLAKKLRDKAQALGVSVQLVSMADYKTSGLKNEKNLLLLVSTHGEGEPPDSAVLFHQFLHSKRAPKLDASLRYSVLALGDSSYQNFCKTGVDLDTRLAELGPTRLTPRAECDVDFGATADAWMEAVLMELTKTAPVALPSLQTQPSEITPAHDRDRPYTAMLLDKILLNGRGSSKETHHYEISLDGSGLCYEPGDALGVIPRNTPDVVEEFLSVLKLSPNARVLTPAGEMSAQDACERHLDIRLLTRPIFKAYAEWSGHPALLELLAEGRREELSHFLYGRQLLDLLTQYPIADLDTTRLFGMLRKITPRLYSIASSPRAHPEEVHILVGATRYHSHGRLRKGVCSCYLADTVEPEGTLDVFIEPNANFRLPADPSRDIIMVGPGTGVAPFRSFVEDRQETGASGRNWLFFGDQHFATDFLYQTEWQQALKGGALHRLDLAFSRDQAAKVYVQDRMRERSLELWDWLENGAHFYVCGDATHMARDIEAELLRLATGPGGKSPEAADEWLADLRAQKRYQRDVY